MPSIKKGQKRRSVFLNTMIIVNFLLFHPLQGTPVLLICDNIMLSLNITEYSYKSLLCVFEKCIESRIEGEKVFIFPLLI